VPGLEIPADLLLNLILDLSMRRAADGGTIDSTTVE